MTTKRAAPVASRDLFSSALFSSALSAVTPGALLLFCGLTGCQLFGQDPARCDQSAATVRQAIAFKDFESARRWRDYTWKVCDERAVVATLDKEILDGETALDAEAKTATQAQQLAQQRINAAQKAWYAYDAGKSSEHTQEVLDATRKSAKRLEEGLPPAHAEQIAAYNTAQYEKRLAALSR